MSKTLVLVSALLFICSTSIFAQQRQFTAKNSLHFIENKGQVTDQYGKPRPDIDFVIRTAALSVFIGKAEIHYQFYRDNGHASADHIVNGYRLDVLLNGAKKKMLSLARKTATAIMKIISWRLPRERKFRPGLTTRSSIVMFTPG